MLLSFYENKIQQIELSMQHSEWKQALLFIVWAIKPGRKNNRYVGSITFSATNN